MVADPQKLEEIRERGFALIEGVLDANEAASMRERLQKCIDDDLIAWQGKPYADAWMVHNLMVRGEPFVRLLENSKLHAHLGELLGDTCILYAYTSSSMPAGGSNYSHRIHVDSPRFIPGYVTNVGVMLALDDYTLENGATYYLPGSHLSDAVPTEAEFFARAERTFPKAGDAVVFNARTWHLGGKNTTGRARHAATMNVCRSYMRQRFDYARLVPSAIVEQLGDVGRRFLGFDVRMPVSLEEYYVPEERRLYKANQG